MGTVEKLVTGAEESPWAPIIHDVLVAADVRQVSYVPDAGHTRLIRLCEETGTMRTVVLTTEEEGVAMSVGAWIGGQRSVLLMQSSGVGNCVNMFSMLANCRAPFLSIVTMRGEYHEFNPWQVPMGSATGQAFEMMGVKTIRVERLEDLGDLMASAATMAFSGDQAIAVLLPQRLLGAKKWVK